MKKGDYVLVESGVNYISYCLTKIKNITPTGQISLENGDRFDKHLRQIGGRYSRLYIGEKAIEEIYSHIKESGDIFVSEKQKLKDKIKSLEDNYNNNLKINNSWIEAIKRSI